MAWSPEPYSDTAFHASSDSAEFVDEKTLRHHLPSSQVRQNGLATVKRKNKSKKKKKGRNEINHLAETYENSTLATVVPGISAGIATTSIMAMDDEFSMEDIESLKELTCCMAKKREIRSHLLKHNQRIVKSGFAAWREQNAIRYKRFQEDAAEVLRQTQLWRSSIHEIEGRFGNGIRSYFAFLRWLFHLNIYIFIIVFSFIVIPAIIYQQDNTPVDTNCTESFKTSSFNEGGVYDFSQYVIWWFTGQGFLVDTLLFHGHYEATPNFSYNLAVAYILVAFAYFGLSLFLLLRRAGRGLKESLVTEENKFFTYCNKVFGGWDFCITDNNAALLKHSSLKYELETDLEEERIRLKHANRTRKEKVILYLKRILINFLVLCVLGGSLYAIYLAANYALTNSNLYSESDFLLNLIITYLASIVITIANFIAPIIFEFLIQFEDYTPAFAIKMTLIRTVFLRLASVMFLYVVVYFQVKCQEFNFINRTYDPVCEFCNGTQCWETYMGQEMYKLTILDFFIVVGVTLFVEFPRRLIVQHCHCRLAQFWGHQEFKIPTNVLDIVYAQTIMWIGTFYAPLLPVIVIIKFFVFFYLKKLTLVYNCRPATRPYRASRSGAFFFIILLFGFAVAAIPVGVSIAVIPPSRSCGLYKTSPTMFSIITTTITTWPAVLRDIFWFLGSPGFAVIAGVILCLILYYYTALKSAHKKMIQLLKEQLALEGKDKQFLLNRVTALQEQITTNQLQTNPRYRNLNKVNVNVPDDTNSADSVPGTPDQN